MEENSSASGICVSQALVFSFAQIKLSSSSLIMNCMLIFPMDTIEINQFKWKTKQNRSNKQQQKRTSQTNSKSQTWPTGKYYQLNWKRLQMYVAFCTTTC